MKLNLTLIFFLFLAPGFSQEFELNHCAVEYEDARCAVKHETNGYFITGLEKGAIDSLGSLYLLHINEMGEPINQSFYDQKGEDGGGHIMKCIESGYIITGHTQNTFDLECDGYILKVDEEGQLQWKLQVGEVLDDVLSKSIQLPNGFILSIGLTENYGATGKDFLLCATTKDGVLKNAISIGTVFNDIASYIIPSNDGEHVYISGYTSYPNGEKRGMLVKCSPLGTVEWIAHSSLKDGVRYNSITELPNGDVVAVGSGKAEDEQLTHGVIGKYDSNGKELWNIKQRYNGILELNSIRQDDTGLLLVYGRASSNNSDISDYFVANIDPISGQIITSQTIGTQKLDRLLDALILKDGSMLMSGFSRGDLGETESYLVKTDFDGALGLNKSINRIALDVYPNPSTGQLIISGNKEDIIDVSVFDLNGELCLKLKPHSNTLDLSELPNGVYIFELKTSQGVYSKKVVKL